MQNYIHPCTTDPTQGHREARVYPRTRHKEVDTLVMVPTSYGTIVHQFTHYGQFSDVSQSTAHILTKAGNESPSPEVCVVSVTMITLPRLILLNIRSTD